jgi:hypothetical protein
MYATFGVPRDLFQLGDHLRVMRLGGLFAHEGIYAGDGCVIHVEYGGVADEVPLARFAGGGVPQVVRRAATWLEGEAIVDRARRRLGQPYHAISFNCQHLPNDAITGRAFSPIVNGLVFAGAAVGLTVVLAGSRHR